MSIPGRVKLLTIGYQNETNLAPSVNPDSGCYHVHGYLNLNTFNASNNEKYYNMQNSLNLRLVEDLSELQAKSRNHLRYCTSSLW